jgi:transposase-like protein
MTAINLQVDTVECPHCKSIDVEYESTDFGIYSNLEKWTCNECKNTFFVRVKTSIMEIFRS